MIEGWKDKRKQGFPAKILRVRSNTIVCRAAAVPWATDLRAAAGQFQSAALPVEQLLYRWGSCSTPSCFWRCGGSWVVAPAEKHHHT